MSHGVYHLPYNSATPDNHRSARTARSRPKKFLFLYWVNKPVLFSSCNICQRLLMVGPAASEWNVLRTTDGERFVVALKNNGFWGELLTARIKSFMR
jgi:hypothetical protein